MKSVISADIIERKIYLIRGHKVMFDSDLAELYAVETGALNRAVKRNAGRFPEDFMFQLTAEEFAALRCQTGILEQHENLRSQFVTLKAGRGKHRKYRPYAFTEQGVAMLSSVLNSKRAIEVNVQIMRTFVKLREMIASHKDLGKRLDELEKKYDRQFAVVFDAIRELMTPPYEDKRKIGFLAKESRAPYAASVQRVSGN